MKIVLQRVKNASVSIDGKTYSQIGRGIVLLLGIAKDDVEQDFVPIIEKIINLRIFENDLDKFDKSLKDVEGEVLIVSQFTLFADMSKGRRPFFGGAADPVEAKRLYNSFVEKFRTLYSSTKVMEGKFAAKMTVEINNEGPVTLLFDTAY